MSKHISEIVDKLDLEGLPHWMVDLDPNIYMNAPWICLDLETTNLDKGSATNPHNDVVSAAWCVVGIEGADDTKVYHHRGGIFKQFGLLCDLEMVIKAGGFIVAHNAKFDVQWLMRMGVDPRTVLVYDTMIGEYVLAGNRRWKLGLGEVAKRYGMPEGKAPYVDLLIKGGICPSEIDPAYLRARVIRDVKQTRKIFLEQRDKLVNAQQLQVQFTRCIFTTCLADIEMEGMCLDPDRVYEEYTRAVMELGISMAEFTEEFGEVNPGSGPQMAKLIYGELGFKELKRGSKPIRNQPTKQFPDGLPKVDAGTMSKIEARTPRQKLFLELRKKIGSLNAELTKSLEYFKGSIDETEDGVFYGKFNQTITATHRLSSSSIRVLFDQFKNAKGIQLQNMPRRFKDLIRPKRDGFKIGDIDGSQLEFRGAAYVSQDTKAIYNIRHDVDQHRFTAMALNDLDDKGWDALSKAQKKALRQAAKPDTFKPLYGGTRGTPEQERYYAAFRKEFPELAATQEGWTQTVLGSKQLRMPWGMTWYWPYCEQNRRTGYIDHTTSIYNYPIQNIATAEIIPVAITYLWHRIPRNLPDCYLINTVHDSVTAEIPIGSDEVYKALGCQAFTMDVYHYLEQVYFLDFNVPLGVGVSIGERWESPDATEWEINVERDGEYWIKGERA